MLSYTYKSHNKFELTDKPKPELLDSRDAIVRVTMSSICSSDLHIKHGSVPRAVPGITVGHEMVGIVESVGSDVTKVIPKRVPRRRWRPEAQNPSKRSRFLSPRT